MPHEGQGRAVRLLRLSRSSLAAPAYDKPDRIDLRDGTVTAPEDQGLGDAEGNAGDGLQALQGGGEQLEKAPWIQAHPPR